MYLFPEITQLLKQDPDGHAIGEGHRTAVLDHRPVSQRIAIGHPEFDQVRTIRLQGTHDGQCVVQCRITGSAVDVEKSL